MSRLGRNQIETSLCIQVFFPEHDVRFVAVSENIDTAKGEDDFMELRNLFNEWFVRDTSRKVKNGYRQRALNGDYTGPYAPYGYSKDEQNKHKLVRDEQTAPVVQRIFQLAVEGYSPYKIGRMLRADQILAPRAYLAEKHQRYLKVVNYKHPCDWGATTITVILQNRVYLGHMVGHKVTKPSFKNKRIVAVPEDEWIEVKNTHEPLIDAETFTLAQKVIRVKKRPTKEGEHQIFSGLLKCSTCGQGLSFARGGNSKTAGGKGGRGSFACNQARTRGSGYCSFHYISYVDVYEILLADIRRHAHTAGEQESEFVEMLADQHQSQQKKQWGAALKERDQLKKREVELQTIVRKLYEDNALGRISDEQYVSLSRDFIDEQAKMKERFKLLVYTDPTGHCGFRSWGDFGDCVLDFTPFVRAAKSVQEAMTGKNWVTGEQLSGFDRAIGLLGVIPGGKVASKATKTVTKEISAAVKVEKQSKKVILGCNCFTAGTKVLTDEGEKPIEEIEVGDRVLAKDELNPDGELAYKEVTALYRNQRDDIIKLYVEEQIIETTDNHPFWVEGKGWVFADELQEGDKLQKADGSKMRDLVGIKSFKVFLLPRPVPNELENTVGISRMLQLLNLQ
ncbi:recombinase family protein [Paenibacillus sp. GCM10012307]|uniref:Recombinase family protein n=1 Tax=Paenibacillus roseus TaxID=2798579 RepID=A0A934MRB2_9BACL|nr:recombinase family protein [Paenibacillus roseus]MBJ6364076.1 recombinase family protein [Paenibacillus roseus]